MPQQGLGSDLGSTLVRFNGGVRVNDSVRRRRLSQPCAEQQAQSVGNCGGAIADEQLAQRWPATAVRQTRGCRTCAASASATASTLQLKKSSTPSTII
jgi:hypothetical protein